MADIAARCGVSRVAVSYALSGQSGSVSASTRRRVVAVAKEMGYNPAMNQSARRLIAQHHGQRVLNQAIGVALPLDFGNSTYYSKILNGIMDVMSRNRYGVHINMLLYDWEKELPLVEEAIPLVCGRGEIDGLLVAVRSDWFVAVWLEALRAEPNYGDRPVIGLVEPIAGCSSVHADDYKSGYLAASHLLELGHRHMLHGFIAAQEIVHSVVVNPENAWAKRLSGMEQAFRDLRLDPNQYLHGVVLTPPSFTADTLAGALRDFPEVTAIVAPNDVVGATIVSELTLLGLSVPHDISLIGFDGTEPIALPRGGLLTTIRIPLETIGQEGAKLMIASINGEVRGTHDIALPTELFVRDSTAPPPSRVDTEKTTPI
jgi:DNA-binding LacI/PurR family transcriptional regulator